MFDIHYLTNMCVDQIIVGAKLHFDIIIFSSVLFNLKIRSILIIYLFCHYYYCYCYYNCHLYKDMTVVTIKVD